MLSVWRRYRAAKDRLLALPFVTITDYLFELRAISRIMHRLGPNGLLYLAAAVSDFFLPACFPLFFPPFFPLFGLSTSTQFHCD